MPTDTLITSTAIDQPATAVLQHIARYRMSVFPALVRLPEFAGQRAANVKQALRELKRLSMIDSATLHHRMQYWHLANDGARHCGLSQARCGPLSEVGKIRAYAFLDFCCLQEVPRRPLTDEEVQAISPDWDRPGLPPTYYFDASGDGCVGLCRVDVGRRGRWDRIVGSVGRDIAAHTRRAGFRHLVQAGRFEVTVLTALEQKAIRLREVFATRAYKDVVPVRILTMRQLIPLIASAS